MAAADALRLARRSGLPAPLWNPRLYDARGRFLASPDAWFEEVGRAWEIDSHEFLPTPEGYDTTPDRRSTMTAAGIVVLHTRAEQAPRPGYGDAAGAPRDLRAGGDPPAAGDPRGGRLPPQLVMSLRWKRSAAAAKKSAAKVTLEKTPLVMFPQSIWVASRSDQAFA